MKDGADEYIYCSVEGCTNRFKNHKWGYIHSGGQQGWFHSKEGWHACPEHLPDWVAEWRAKRDLEA